MAAEELLVILTVTMNAAVDEAVAVDDFVLGGSNRCRLDALDAGGKGLNASRVIHRLNRLTIALGFVGGVTGQMVRARLDEERVLHAFDDVPELTRLNVMIYESSSGRRSRLYLPGATVAPERLGSLRTRLLQAHPGGTVILGGSLPPGLESSTYAALVSWLHERGVRAVVDTSGPALSAVLPARPLLIKPNVEEAAECLGCTLSGDDEVLAAALALRARGPANVVISQGEGGAIGVSAGGAWKALAPRVTARSTVGSGDSMVAGLTIALDEGGSLEDGLRLGTAAGAATAMIPGTQLCNVQDVERLLPEVDVKPIVRRSEVRLRSDRRDRD
ncbi:MAG TPA: 1-phosphofructokinase [Candidatus Acidoferrales bacterium]|nr:1-phosphofructokinase [Candidatus Acidoferrales bacterium]